MTGDRKVQVGQNMKSNVVDQNYRRPPRYWGRPNSDSEESEELVDEREFREGKNRHTY